MLAFCGVGLWCVEAGDGMVDSLLVQFVGVDGLGLSGCDACDGLGVKESGQEAGHGSVLGGYDGGAGLGGLACGAVFLKGGLQGLLGAVGGCGAGFGLCVGAGAGLGLGLAVHACAGLVGLV